MDNELSSFITIFTEFYYWVTVVFMFFIHVGFCVYEVGASRWRNHKHTLLKNTMIIPLVTVTWYLFGWWMYFALPNGPGITGPLLEAGWATPWSEFMGTHLGGSTFQEGLSVENDGWWSRINGVFFAAFLLFSWTAASIVSGACLERIRPSAYWICAVAIGSFFWVIDAAWGWHPDGWMVQLLGYHDAYASGVIHAIAGGFALGVIIVLGPRLGKFRADGTPRNINPHNPWLVTVGLFLIFSGFWGFYVACNIPMLDVGAGDGGSYFTATNIYLTPTTLSAITFNFLMSLSGGMLAAFIVSKGDVLWIYYGGLAGVIGASAGNDLYHPIQACIIGMGGAWVCYKGHFFAERVFKVDDPLGAVAVHGYAGIYGLIVVGFMLWGYPASMNPDYAHISPLGQLAGAAIMFGLLGFLPGFIIAHILKAFGLLRVPRGVELAGLDLKEIHTRYEEKEELRAALAKEPIDG